MDAMGAAHAQGFLELESSTLAGFTQQGDVLQNDVQRLDNLIGKDVYKRQSSDSPSNQNR